MCAPSPVRDPMQMSEGAHPIGPLNRCFGSYTGFRVPEALNAQRSVITSTARRPSTVRTVFAQLSQRIEKRPNAPMSLIRIEDFHGMQDESNNSADSVEANEAAEVIDEQGHPPAVADDVLPDSLYLIPVPQRPFFPGQVQPVAMDADECQGAAAAEPAVQSRSCACSSTASARTIRPPAAGLRREPDHLQQGAAAGGAGGGAAAQAHGKGAGAAEQRAGARGGAAEDPRIGRGADAQAAARVLPARAAQGDPEGARHRQGRPHRGGGQVQGAPEEADAHRGGAEAHRRGAGQDVDARDRLARSTPSPATIWTGSRCCPGASTARTSWT
jgi:hypothetical protein